MRDLLDGAGYNRLIKMRYGYMLYNSNDTVVGLSIAHYGEYFESEVDIFRSVLRPGDIAIDAGANMGTHALAMARLVGPAGRVVALEPQRLVFQILCANAAINSLEHLECLHAAAGERDEIVLVGDNSLKIPNNFGGQALTAVPGKQRARVIRLDDHFVHDRLRLIKIDVEGMEAEVLRGARGLIETFQPVLYVENHDVAKSEALLRLLDGFGYDCHWHLSLFHNPNNFFGTAERSHPQEFFDGGAYLDSMGFAINMICVRKDGAASIEGFYPLLDFAEHPLKREWNARFLRPPEVGAARRVAGVG